MDDDLDKILTVATADLHDRFTENPAIAVDLWYVHWKSQCQDRSVLPHLRATANLVRMAHMANPPGPNQQIVFRDMGDGNVVQIASSNSPGVPVSKPEPIEASWRDAAPYLAALAGATVAVAWFIPIPHNWRAGITVVPLVAELFYAFVAWLQARISTWEKRVLYWLATIVTAEVCLRRYLSGFSVEAGRSDDKVWFHLLPHEADDPLVVAAKIGLAALLVVLAFFTKAT